MTSSPTHKSQRGGSCGVKAEVQAWVRSRSRKYYKASEVVFMLMRADELQDKRKAIQSAEVSSNEVQILRYLK